MDYFWSCKKIIIVIIEDEPDDSCRLSCDEDKLSSRYGICIICAYGDMRHNIYAVFGWPTDGETTVFVYLFIFLIDRVRTTSWHSFFQITSRDVVSFEH